MALHSSDASEGEVDMGGGLSDDTKHDQNLNRIQLIEEIALQISIGRENGISDIAVAETIIQEIRQHDQLIQSH